MSYELSKVDFEIYNKDRNTHYLVSWHPDVGFYEFSVMIYTVILPNTQYHMKTFVTNVRPNYNRSKAFIEQARGAPVM